MFKFIKVLFCKHELEVIKRKKDEMLFSVCKRCGKPLPQDERLWRQIQTWKNYREF